MTAQGSALTRYRRALERRHIFGAEIAAKEMGFLSLRDALGLLALYAAELPSDEPGSHPCGVSSDARSDDRLKASGERTLVQASVLSY